MAAARFIRRGDIYWVTPGGGSEVSHPHLVLQEDALNQSRVQSVVVCALSSNLQRAHEPGNVLLEPGEGDLPRQSVLVVSQVSAIDKSTLGEYVGSLSSERVEQVFDGLRFQQATFFGGR